jgi:hypothetical protein
MEMRPDLLERLTVAQIPKHSVEQEGLFLCSRTQSRFTILSQTSAAWALPPHCFKPFLMLSCYLRASFPAFRGRLNLAVVTRCRLCWCSHDRSWSSLPALSLAVTLPRCSVIAPSFAGACRLHLQDRRVKQAVLLLSDFCPEDGGGMSLMTLLFNPRLERWAQITAYISA